MSRRPVNSGGVERLWTAPDGTVCLLATGTEPPMYSVSIVRGAQVLRERSFYSHATARMMAQGWNDSEGGNNR
jgi:hypothetical protein